jgi:hypothetical protein
MKRFARRQGETSSLTSWLCGKEQAPHEPFRVPACPDICVSPSSQGYLSKIEKGRASVPEGFMESAESVLRGIA